MGVETVTYTVRGTTDDVTTCEVCGRADLQRTVILAMTLGDGSDEGVLYAGTDCAARRAGRTEKHVRGEAKRADDAARTEQERARHAAMRAETAAFLAWVAATYGVTVDQPAYLHDHREALGGLTPFQARKAWKAAA